MAESGAGEDCKHDEENSKMSDEESEAEDQESIYEVEKIVGISKDGVSFWEFMENDVKQAFLTGCRGSVCHCLVWLLGLNEFCVCVWTYVCTV